MPWLASPKVTVALGCLLLLRGALGAASGAPTWPHWGFWVVLGAVALASAGVRQVEVRRHRRFSGALGALGWLSAPLWGKYRNTRPPFVREDSAST